MASVPGRNRGRLRRTVAIASDPSDGEPGLVGAIGGRVAHQRALQGLSIDELAQRAGISNGLLSQIERGIGNPSLSTLVGLANALDMPLGAFFAGAADEGDMVVAPQHPPRSEAELEEYLSQATDRTISTMAALNGDLLVLGAGGKLGLSVCRMARRSLDAAGKTHTRVIAVSRFGDQSAMDVFRAVGIEPIAADLMDDAALERLPETPNVLYLVGMKFGSTGDMPRTWALNTFLPGLVARRFASSHIVALSTGNVYPHVDVRSGGATEDHPTDPVGEYAISCLGRERMFSYYSQAKGTPVALVRLNYAVDLRYGVLVDIAQRVLAHEPIDLAMSCVNVIWQGDANAAILRCFDHCASPPFIVNVTGPETLSVEWVAQRFAELLGTERPMFVGEERATALLSNTHRQQQLFGYPRVPTGRLMEWVADWLQSGGRLLGKPTGFQNRDGRF